MKRKGHLSIWGTFTLALVVAGSFCCPDITFARESRHSWKDSSTDRRGSSIFRRKHVKHKNSTGDVSGVLSCDAADSANGSLVYIPGLSFMAKTGSTGHFTLYDVPAGTYSLIVEVPGREPFESDEIKVRPHRTTDLGTLQVCTGPGADADGDGFSPPEDCNDNDTAINPGAEEVCGDSIDNNCDTQVDEGCSTPVDLDQDGFDSTVDCDDNDATINPGAEEVCGDGVDNNCDGQTDEGCTAPVDADGDGFSPPEDCDDENASVNPGAEEVCSDNIDNNCDGQINENCAAAL